MLIVGLTGGIATGKSTVSTLLAAKGVPVIDADVLAREVVAPGTPGLAQVVRTFGEEVLLSDGSGGLDRKKLGTVVFSDEAKRKKLNAIVHPAVRKAILWSVVKYWLRGERWCVLDVPLLIEAGLWKWVAKVAVVYCSPEVQLERLMLRDGSTREDAQARLNAQLSITEKVAYADETIDNTGTEADLLKHIDKFVQRIEREAGWSWRLSWLVPPIGILFALKTLVVRLVTKRNLSRRSNEENKTK